MHLRFQYVNKNVKLYLSPFYGAITSISIFEGGLHILLQIQKVIWKTCYETKVTEIHKGDLNSYLQAILVLIRLRSN